MTETKNAEDLIYVQKQIFNAMIHKLEYILNEKKEELSLFELEQYTNEYYFFRYMYDSLCEFESFLIRKGLVDLTDALLDSFLKKAVNTYTTIDTDVEYDYYMNL